MTPSELQTYLKTTGRYSGPIDGGKPGWYGKLTQGAILLALTDGPDTPLQDRDYIASGVRLVCPPSHIAAFAYVEANGAGSQDGRPKILPEPHRFSKATQHRYDKNYPTISYPVWGTRPYPVSQDARYDELLKMVGLDIDAGFASVSYGKFQIMGENYEACGYKSPFAFAEAQARDELTQLKSFEGFITSRGLLGALRTMSTNPDSCRAIAKGYNGTAYANNDYHTKLANALPKFEYLNHL